MARKQYEVVISANGKVAEKVLEGLRAEASKFKEEMENLEKAGKKQTAEFVRAEKAYESLNSAVEKAEKGMKKLEEVLDDLAGSTTKELRGALRQTKGIIDSLSANDPRRERFVNDFKKIKEQIDKNNQSLKDSSKEIDENSNALGKNAASWKEVVKGISVYSIAAKALDFVKGKIGSVVRGNFELSDSMAAVRKVTGMTADEIATLTTRLSKMDTRTTLADLNAIAEAGGRMGLAKYGIQGMEQFVKAANQIQVALGDDLGNSIDESILPLAKLGENLGLFEKMGVDKAMLAIGSSINELGATSTAQGANIVDFARRIQASAQLARVSASDILALGSAVDAAGITSEVGASSFQKFFAAIRTNTGAIEKALDIPKGKIDELYNANRTMDATILILQKMKEKGGMRELGDIFKLLGSKGSQMTATFSAMANNVDILSEHLRVSREAFGEQISITNEFNSVQETAQGYLERAQNLWQNAFVNPEGVDVVKDLAVEFYNLSKEMTSSESTMQSIKTSLGMVAGAAKILLQMLPALIRLLMFYGVVDGIKKIGVEFVAMKDAIGGATGAMNKLGAAIKANAFALVASVVLTVATSIYDMAKASEEAANKLDAMGEATDEAMKSCASERAELKRLYEATQDQTKSIQERTEAINELRAKYPGYFNDLTNEQILAGQATDAYNKLAQSIINAAKARAYQKKIEELQTKNIELEDEVDKKQKWNDENQEKYDSERRKAARAVNEQNALETSGASFGGGKMGYVRASNAGDKKLIGQYQSNEKQIEANNRQIKANNAQIGKMAEAVTSLTPKNAKGNTTTPTNTATPTVSEKEKKAAAAAARKAEAERKKREAAAEKRNREELKQAKEDSNAILSNIEEYYKLQLATVSDMVADGKLTKKESEVLKNYYEQKRHKALSEAEKAIAGQPNEFNAFSKMQMGGADMINRSEQATMALEKVQSFDTQKAYITLKEKGGEAYIENLMAKSAQDTEQASAAAAKQPELVRDVAKERIDRRYDPQIHQQERDERLQQASGTSQNIWQTYGLQDNIDGDPHVKMLELRMEKEQEWLDFLRKSHAEQELISQQEQSVEEARMQVVESIAQKIQQRIALLQQLTHPIEDFGTAVGDAFATMTTDAEEGRKALQDAVKSMIEQFGKMTIKMYAELMTQKVQQALFHQEMEAEDRRHSAVQTAEEEGGKKRVSVIKAIGALILGQKKKQKKQELKIEQQAQGEQTDVVEQEGESRLSVTNVVETGIASITAKAAQDITQTKQSQAATNAATTAAETEGSVAAGVAGGAAKIIGTLGWWGIPLIAVITALLNGLLAFALGKLFGGSKSQNSSSSATNVKLKSGMLTYDSGNIHTVLGTDGRVYQARDEGTIQTGIVRSPITASVNGQPSIIGERGPELVVGRETTRAIMLSRPDILKTIAEIDRNRSGRAFRTLDDGDLSALTAGGSVSSDSIAANNKTMQQLAQTVAMLSQTLSAIQQRGIPAHINKYGRGGLIDEVQSGMKFMQKYQ